jgi:hypothetical protein
MAGDQSMRIAELLESRVAVICFARLPMAWPNIAFTPLIMRLTGVFMFYLRKPWGRIWKVSCVRTRAFSSSTSLRQQVGVTQARGLAKSVADAFPEGLPLVDGDLTVYINGPPQVRSQYRAAVAPSPTPRQHAVPR